MLQRNFPSLHLLEANKQAKQKYLKYHIHQLYACFRDLNKRLSYSFHRCADWIRPRTVCSDCVAVCPWTLDDGIHMYTFLEASIRCTLVVPSENWRHKQNHFHSEPQSDTIFCVCLLLLFYFGSHQRNHLQTWQSNNVEYKRKSAIKHSIHTSTFKLNANRRCNSKMI